MLIAGIVGNDNISETAGLVSSILSSTGQKISIADSKNLCGLGPKRIKDYINELSKINVDILILKIGISYVCEELFENISFDILIYTDKADSSDTICKDTGKDNLMRKIISMLDEKSIIIVNADDNELMAFLHGVKNNIVTYGFNSKASITTSSVGDPLFEGKFICSLQETIPAKNGLLIEPQEYTIQLHSQKLDSYNLLAAASFAIVNGIDLNSLS